MARQQEAGFFECFAHGGDPRILLDRPEIAIREGIPGCIRVFIIRLAAGKHERTRRKINLVVPFHHQHFGHLFAVPDDQDSGGKPGVRRGLCHARNLDWSNFAKIQPNICA